MRSPAPSAFGGDPRWLEAGSGFSAVLWALWVVLNGDDLAIHAAYVPLVQFAPEWVWTLLAGAGGLTQMMAARMDRVEARLVCCLVMGPLYLLLADGVWQASASAPTVAIYLGQAASNLVAMLLLASITLRRHRR